MNLGTRGFWVVVFITHLLDKAGCRENNNMERSRNSRRGVRVCVCVCVTMAEAGRNHWGSHSCPSPHGAPRSSSPSTSTRQKGQGLLARSYGWEN